MMRRQARKTPAQLGYAGPFLCLVLCLVMLTACSPADQGSGTAMTVVIPTPVHMEAPPVEPTPRSQRELATDELRTAVSEKDWDRAVEMVRLGADVNALVTYRNTEQPLLIAAICGATSRVAPVLAGAIIESDEVDLDIVSCAGSTPLELAEYYGIPDIVKLLQRRGAHFTAPPEPLVVSEEQLALTSIAARLNLELYYRNGWADTAVVVSAEPYSSTVSESEEERYGVHLRANCGFECAVPLWFTLDDSLESCVLRREDFTILLMRNLCGMDNPLILTVWDVLDDGRWRLRTILDMALIEEWGGGRLRALVPVDEERSLIFAETSSADGGELWGTLWIGMWTLPRHLTVLDQLHFSLSVELEHEVLESIRLDLEVDSESLQAYVWERVTRGPEPVSEKLTVLDLCELIERSQDS